MVSKALGKYVQSLHQKKYRQRHGAFLVEGGKNVLELLSSDLETEQLLATAEFATQNRAQLPARLPLTLVSETELTQLGTLANNTTALAVARLPAEAPLPLTLPESQLLLALDEVRDPGNLGTLLRLADWYGLAGVVLSPGCADAFAPKTVSATMGAFARVPVWERDLAAWLPTLPAGTGIFGADLEGDNVHRVQLQPRGVLVMGSESHGLTPGVAAALTRRLHIPRGAAGRAESLNVAISAAILLDNFFRGQ
ncbi:RNA methyltransferase [Hymenobacter properus]|uniref:RNA methyltransferase n=1 Tax=Hymenobacter properus TaxID=2791026 RepID=A0A931BFA8_9BACT|nr:RNA methyltransferase [Hymenobacter properus]MBF9140257.1 RNA methyltransferase [Hymenobacter properus]MBR7719064.1 RNA methyltransferase [Microvirga sp. SRT04]